jgi:hypothetical protein
MLPRHTYVQFLKNVQYSLNRQAVKGISYMSLSLSKVFRLASRRMTWHMCALRNFVDIVPGLDAPNIASIPSW